MSLLNFSSNQAICPLTVSVTIQLGLGRNLYALQSRLDPAQLQSHFPPTDGDLTVQFLHQGPPLLGTLHFLMRSSARNELDMLRAFGRVCTLIGVFVSRIFTGIRNRILDFILLW